jgi:hypothetical protein
MECHSAKDHVLFEPWFAEVDISRFGFAPKPCFSQMSYEHDQ